ncbi:MAG: Mth938-like domain-containing protein [Candidatus Sedimenticola sp. PURPLELP]
MKFTETDPSGGYAVKAYKDGQIIIDEKVFTSSLILMPNKVIPDWRPVCFQDLASGDFRQLIDLEPDLVLLGTGEKHLFPSPALFHSLVDAGIGLESMTTPAACRTYNILMSEGRKVAAALLLA